MALVGVDAVTQSTQFLLLGNCGLFGSQFLLQGFTTFFLERNGFSLGSVGLCRVLEKLRGTTKGEGPSQA
jgi:hypothetical protein